MTKILLEYSEEALWQKCKTLIRPQPINLDLNMMPSTSARNVNETYYRLSHRLNVRLDYMYHGCKCVLLLHLVNQLMTRC